MRYWTRIGLCNKHLYKQNVHSFEISFQHFPHECMHGARNKRHMPTALMHLQGTYHKQSSCTPADIFSRHTLKTSISYHPGPKSRMWQIKATAYLTQDAAPKAAISHSIKACKLMSAVHLTQLDSVEQTNKLQSSWCLHKKLNNWQTMWGLCNLYNV